MMVHTRIASVLMDPNSGLPVVVLIETGGPRALPIVIGVVEAEAIALALQNVKLPRPRTHDLLKNMMSDLGGRLERVVVSDLQDSTFFATLHIRRGRNVVTVDSRPSDAIALAARTGAQIYVEEEVLARAHIKAPSEQDETEAKEPTEPRLIYVDDKTDTDELADLLANLEPKDFGKYKM